MSFRKLEWDLALRFLFSLKSQRFLWILTLFGLLLVMATIALTYTVVCVAEGFSKDLRTKLLNTRPHITVTLHASPPEMVLQTLARDADVTAIIPVIVGSVLLDTGKDGQEGIHLWGIDEKDRSFLNRFQCEWIGEGQPSDLYRPSADGVSRAIVGSELFQDLYLRMPAGGELSLLYPFGDVDPFGNTLPSVKKIEMLAACESGVYTVDRKTMIVDARQARVLFSQYEPAYNRLWIYLDHPDRVDAVVARTLSQVDGWGNVSTWRTDNATLFGALSLERKVVAFIIVLVFMLASLSLYGMLSLLVIEKRGDFAVLSTLGYPERQFMRILLRMTAIIAVLGSAVGGGLGAGVVAILSHYPLPLPEAYYVRDLAISQEPFYWGGIVIASAAVQLLSAILPGVWLARQAPVEALRFVEGGVV